MNKTVDIITMGVNEDELSSAELSTPALNVDRPCVQVGSVLLLWLCLCLLTHACTQDDFLRYF